MDSRTLSQGDESTLDQLLIRWEELRRLGSDVSVEAITEGRPELRDEFRRRIGDAKATGVMMPSTREESMTQDSGPTTTNGAPSGPRRVSSRVEYGGLRFHAEGGLGEVFLARNTELNRDVALKFLKHSRAGDPDSRRRFLVEAEVTGRLEHRGVVPVYALGLDSDGVPCYAMRFIRGNTLHDAIEAFHKSPPVDLASGRDLDLRGLLGRFVAVCNTVAYAHSRGVLHRDIKPRNIMLGKYDETLLVDWGLAKRFDRLPSTEPADLFEEDILEATSGPESGSETHGVVGTPSFMSPEQATPGAAVGPLGDVYALGATLYAVLTGRPPVDGGQVGEVLENVRKGQIHPLRRINPAIPRPLEAICLKAMAGRPEGRYATALALAEDVDRWLSDQPVAAYPDPWTTRLRRWATRNRWRMVALAAVLLAAIAVPVAVSIVEAEGKRQLAQANVAITRQRDAADLARKKAEAVQSFLTGDLLAQAAPARNARGKKVTIEEALDRASSTIGARFRDQPEVEAAVRRTIGQTYHALGEYEKAAPHLIRSLEILEATQPANNFDRISSVANLAVLRNAQGRYDEAEPLLRRAWQGFRETLGPDHPEAMVAQGNLAILLMDTRRPAEAEPLIREVLEGRTRTLGPDHPDTLRSLNTLATIIHDLDRIEEAEAIHRRILEIRRRTLGPDHPQSLNSLSNLGATLLDLKKFAEAEAVNRAADEAEARVLGEDHPDRLTTLFNLGCVFRDSGKLVEARATFDRCLQGRRRMLGDDNLATVSTEHDVADLAWTLGEMTGVEAAYRHILAVRRKQLGDSDSLTLGPANNLASLLMDRGADAEAESILRWAVPEMRKHPELRNALPSTIMLWGVSLVDSGRAAEGEPLVREAMAMRRAALPPSHMGIASAENVLGHCLARQGRFEEAERLMLESYPRLVGPPSWAKLGLAIRRIVGLYRDWGKPAEAGRWQAILDDLSFPALPFAPE